MSLERADLWLTEQLRAAGSQPPLGAILGQLVESWPLQGLIDEIVASPHRLGDLARRSYLHPNGFARIELIAGGSVEFGLRLHVWAPGRPELREAVHGHPWSFASRVLVGTLVFEIFVEDKGGEATPTLYYPRPDGGDTYLVETGAPTNLRCVTRGTMPQGHCYSAHHTLIHRVWAGPGGPAVTLMLHGPGVGYPSRIFGAAIEGRRSQQERLRIAPLELADILTDVRARLDAPAEGEGLSIVGPEPS